jgi:hypothetical protein
MGTKLSRLGLATSWRSSKLQNGPIRFKLIHSVTVVVCDCEQLIIDTDKNVIRMNLPPSERIVKDIFD